MNKCLNVECSVGQRADVHGLMWDASISICLPPYQISVVHIKAPKRNRLEERWKKWSARQDNSEKATLLTIGVHYTNTAPRAEKVVVMKASFGYSPWPNLLSWKSIHLLPLSYQYQFFVAFFSLPLGPCSINIIKVSSRFETLIHPPFCV